MPSTLASNMGLSLFFNPHCSTAVPTIMFIISASLYSTSSLQRLLMMSSISLKNRILNFVFLMVSPLEQIVVVGE